MLLGIERSKDFAWLGAAERPATPSAAILRRRASVRRQGRDGAAVPRRFQPRLAAGFDETAGDGLEDFDRGLAPNPVSALILWLLGA